MVWVEEGVGGKQETERVGYGLKLIIKKKKKL